MILLSLAIAFPQDDKKPKGPLDGLEYRSIGPSIGGRVSRIAQSPGGGQRRLSTGGCVLRPPLCSRSAFGRLGFRYGGRSRGLVPPMASSAKASPDVGVVVSLDVATLEPFLASYSANPLPEPASLPRRSSRRVTRCRSWGPSMWERRGHRATVSIDCVNLIMFPTLHDTWRRSTTLCGL